MKVIKNPHANLETKRFRFFKVGLIVACSLTLLAFRWTTYELKEENSSKIELKTFHEMEPEIPKVFVRPKQKVVKVNFDNRFFEPKKDEVVVTSPDQTPVKMKMFIDLPSVECPECPIGEDVVTDPPIPTGTFNWMKAERTPYFDECASPSDREAEADCTYAAIRNFVQKNTKYPALPREMNIQGTVWLTFVINKKGEVSEIEVIKSPHSELSAAAVKGLSMLPKMNPGLQRLNPVDVKLEIPVKFKLQ